jgi:hypothetical protein
MKQPSLTKAEIEATARLMQAFMDQAERDGASN